MELIVITTIICITLLTIFVLLLKVFNRIITNYVELHTQPEVVPQEPVDLKPLQDEIDGLKTKLSGLELQKGFSLKR